MFFPEEKIAEIVEKNDIVDVVSSYCTLTKKGNNYWACCPFHSEKTPSFSVSPAKQIFYCFGCGEGGNVVKFIEKIERCSFVEAMTLLAERAKVPLPEENQGNDSRGKERKLLYAMNREAALYFHSNLRESKTAMAYLTRRGLNIGTIRRFGLGYSLDSWNALENYLLGKGYSRQQMEQAGLLLPKKDKQGYYDRFRNRIMFPIIDLKGNVIGFGGRVLDDSKPKYLNSPDTEVFNKGYHMYAINLVKQVPHLKNIIIVEGYMDVIALHQFGVNNVVASLGTAFTEHQAKLLKRYVNEVIIGYDMDTAGRTATLRGISILEKQGMGIKVLKLPSGKDPDEYIRKEGIENFQKVLSQSIPMVEYQIERSKEGLDFGNIQDRVRFAKKLAKILSGLDSRVEIDEYIKKYAKETQIGESALYAEVNQITGKQTAETSRQALPAKADSLRSCRIYSPEEIMEQKLLCICVSDERLARRAFESIEVDDFQSEINKNIANLIYSQIKAGKFASAGELLYHMANEDERTAAMEVFRHDMKDFNLSVEMRELIQKIKQNKVTKQIQTLTETMNRLFLEHRQEEANDVFKEITRLQKEKVSSEGKR